LVPCFESTAQKAIKAAVKIKEGDEPSDDAEGQLPNSDSNSSLNYDAETDRGQATSDEKSCRRWASWSKSGYGQISRTDRLKHPFSGHLKSAYCSVNNVAVEVCVLLDRWVLRISRKMSTRRLLPINQALRPLQCPRCHLQITRHHSRA
jgi:hypothetical protein